MALLKDSERLITGEELFHSPDLGPCELVDGRIVPLPPTRPEHGEIELNLGSELKAWVRSSGRGRVSGGEVGLYIRRNPDTVRAADLNRAGGVARAVVAAAAPCCDAGTGCGACRTCADGRACSDPAHLGGTGRAAGSGTGQVSPELAVEHRTVSIAPSSAAGPSPRRASSCR